LGVILLLVYPLRINWPSGWIWHGGMGIYHLQMIFGIHAVLGIFLILAANKPGAYRSLISFTLLPPAGTLQPRPYCPFIRATSYDRFPA
jgi:hypothetical protein